MTNDHLFHEIEEGGSNVFSDLGLEDAPELKLKAALAGEVNTIIDQLQLTESQAAELLDQPPSNIKSLKHGKLSDLSFDDFIRMIIKLDRDVEFRVSKSSDKKHGRYHLRNGNTLSNPSP